MRVSVALNVRTPPVALASLASDKSWEVREAVSRNPGLDRKFLEELSSHWAWKVREAVALNPSTPKEILERMSQDPDQSVNKAAREQLARTRLQKL